MLPVSERRKPRYNKKEKFATQDTSKNAKRCPKCKAIFHMSGECPNCRYKHLYGEDMPGIVKASELEGEKQDHGM